MEKQERILTIINYLEQHQEISCTDLYEWAYKNGFEKEFLKMENYILEVLRERKIKNLEKRIIEIEKKIK